MYITSTTDDEYGYRLLSDTNIFATYEEAETYLIKQGKEDWDIIELKVCKEENIIPTKPQIIQNVKDIVNLFVKWIETVKFYGYDEKEYEFECFGVIPEIEYHGMIFDKCYKTLKDGDYYLLDDDKVYGMKKGDIFFIDGNKGVITLKN